MSEIRYRADESKQDETTTKENKMKKTYVITRKVETTDKFGRISSFIKKEILCTADLKKDIQILKWNVVKIA